MSIYFGRIVSCFIPAALLVSGCAVVTQPVYRVPDNNCKDKDSSCVKLDGIPYVLPRTIIKASIPVVATKESEGRWVSEVRKVFATDRSCSWDSSITKPCNGDKPKVKKNKEKKNKSKDKEACACTNEEFAGMFTKANNICLFDIANRAEKLGIDLNLRTPLAKTFYKMGDVALVSESEPDPSQVFFVEVKGGLFERRSVDVAFAAGGVLADITTSKEDKSLEFATKTGSSIIGAVIKAGATIASTDGKTAPMTCGAYGGVYQRGDGLIRVVDSYPTDRADIIKSKTSALSKEYLELALKELKASYDEARSSFEVNKEQKTKTYEIAFLPDKFQPKNKEDEDKKFEAVKIAKFSDTCGIVAASEGRPNRYNPLMLYDFKDSNKCGTEVLVTAEVQTLSYFSVDRSVDDVVSKSLNTGNDIRGVHYRIPLASHVSIFSNKDKDKKELAAKDISIAQFGSVASLPATTGSSNVTYKVTLDPTTGMLLKVNISSEPMSTDVGKNLIDPLGDYIKAQKTKDDELTQLQRQKSILEAKKAIADLTKALSQ